jgi:hypothetical protein
MKPNKTKKLALALETVRMLDHDHLRAIHGGVTYSLSTGDRCQKSNEMSGGGSTCRC